MTPPSFVSNKLPEEGSYDDPASCIIQTAPPATMSIIIPATIATTMPKDRTVVLVVVVDGVMVITTGIAVTSSSILVGGFWYNIIAVSDFELRNFVGLLFVCLIF